MSFESFLGSVRSFFANDVDIDFTLWLSWLLMPLLVTFLAPLLIGIMLYVNVIIVYISRWHWRHLRDSYEAEDYLNVVRKLIAAIWDAQGWLFHGYFHHEPYEISGIEHIPNDSSALIVYYHGAIPTDLYYLLAKVMLYKNRLVHTVADNFLFRIPGWKTLSEAFNVIPGTVHTCSNVLKDGNLLAIAPGGVYEAQFSINYSLMWKSRLGFAKVALSAQVPIIPMFTENNRESFRTVNLFQGFWLKLYSLTKFPCAPIFGGFPVKLTTHLGPPIPYDPNLTPEQLQIKVATALEDLIKKHQRIPGRIHSALLDRIPMYRNRKEKRK